MGPGISNGSGTYKGDQCLNPDPPFPLLNLLVTGTQASFSETLITSLLSSSGTESLSCTVKSSITDLLSAIVFLCFLGAERVGAQWFPPGLPGCSRHPHLLLCYTGGSVASSLSYLI